MKAQRGFSLIEILVVIGTLGLILTTGLLIDTQSLGREELRSEEINLVTVLQKARSRAMNNIEQSEHGVHIALDRYVIFEGSIYDNSDSKNESVERNKNISIDTSGVGTNDVIFMQLSGKSHVTGDLVLRDGVNNKTITIWEQGLIDW